MPIGRTHGLQYQWKTHIVKKVVQFGGTDRMPTSWYRRGVVSCERLKPFLADYGFGGRKGWQYEAKMLSQTVFVLASGKQVAVACRKQDRPALFLSRFVNDPTDRGL